LEGFAAMFEHKWKEETENARRFIDYGINRGSSVKLQAIPVQKESEIIFNKKKQKSLFSSFFVLKKINESKWKTKNVCEILGQVLDLEKSLYKHQLDMHKCGNGNEIVNVDPQVKLDHYC
jgi:hypothetical protein